MKRAYRWCMTRVDRFLFDGCDPIMCSVMRITYALVLIVYLAMWIVEANVWFVDSGVLTAETAQQIGHHQYWSLLFWLPSTSPIVLTCLYILLVQSVLLLLGVGSRFQAVCIFIGITSFQHRNGLICDGQDVLVRWWIFCMIFMPLDYAWSLGRWLRGDGRHAVSADRASAWGLRLVQLQITAVYLSTAWMKWQGQTWRDGTAVYYVARMDDLFGRFWLPDFLFETPWIVKSMTWGVVGVEALLPLFLWLRPTRRLAIVTAVALHLSIEYAMHIYLFEWIMIVGVLSFVQPRQWAGLFRGGRRRRSAELPASRPLMSES
jgi:hypothetical protein